MDSEQFVFEKVQGGYALVKCYDSEKNAVIPDTFQGEPVLEIRQSALHECNTITALTLPSSLKKVEEHAIGPCRALEKVTCLSETAQFHRDSFYICWEIDEMPFSVWEQVSLYAHNNNNILKNYQKDWDSINPALKENILDFVSKDQYIKRWLFDKEEASLISFLLREGVVLTLDELNDFLEISIAQNNTLVTASFLHYRVENYSNEEIEAYNEHRELVEIGLESPTFAEFDRKWMHREVEGGFEIIRYLGDKSEDRMPSSLADGRKIFGTHHIMNGAYSRLKKLIVTEGIRYLDEETFRHSDALEEVILPESLESMGEGCFSVCESLKSINIPRNIKELPKDCFTESVALETVTLHEGLCTLADYCFADCKNLKKITLPQSLKELKQGSRHRVGPLHSSDDYGIFFACAIESITIPPQVTRIPNFSFYACSKLKEVNLHENVTEFGKGAFKFTPLLADKDGFVIINKIFFDFTHKDTVCVVPDYVQRISCKAFVDAEFEEIILPHGLLEIDERAFWDCSALEKITIPSSVKILQENTFVDCEKLEEVLISSGTMVENDALKNCPLAKIILKSDP